MKKIDFDNYADEYNKILDDQLNFFSADSQYFAEYKVKQAKAVLPQTPKTILDFGCGIGRSIHFFQKYFPSSQIYGCETSEKSLEIARKQFPSAHFYQTQELASLGMRFDLIFLAGVLHHIEVKDRRPTIELISAALQPQGNILIFEHNPFNPMTRHLVNTCPFDRDAVLLKPTETKQLLTDAGIHKIKHYYTLFFPAALKWLRPLEYYLRHLPLGGQYLVQGTAAKLIP